MLKLNAIGKQALRSIRLHPKTGSLLRINAGGNYRPLPGSPRPAEIAVWGDTISGYEATKRLLGLLGVVQSINNGWTVGTAPARM